MSVLKDLMKIEELKEKIEQSTSKQEVESLKSQINTLRQSLSIYLGIEDLYKKYR